MIERNDVNQSLIGKEIFAVSPKGRAHKVSVKSVYDRYIIVGTDNSEWGATVFRFYHSVADMPKGIVLSAETKKIRFEYAGRTWEAEGNYRSATLHHVGGDLKEDYKGDYALGSLGNLVCSGFSSKEKTCDTLKYLGISPSGLFAAMEEAVGFVLWEGNTKLPKEQLT